MEFISVIQANLWVVLITAAPLLPVCRVLMRIALSKIVGAVPVSTVVFAVIPPIFPLIIGFVVLAPPTVVVLLSAFPLAVAIIITFPVNFIFVVIVVITVAEPSVGYVSCKGRLVLSDVAISNSVVDR